MKFGWNSIDRLFGDTTGRIILLKGPPSCGKTSLVLKLLSLVGGRLLASEEHASAIAERARRMQLTGLHNIRVCATLSLPEALDSMTNEEQFVVIDSANAFRRVSAEDASRIDFLGNKNAETANVILSAIQFFENDNATVLIVVHAGTNTKMVEHLVDAVFEMDTSLEDGSVLLMPIKNRMVDNVRSSVRLRMTERGFFDA